MTVAGRRPADCGGSCSLRQRATRAQPPGSWSKPEAGRLPAAERRGSCPVLAEDRANCFYKPQLQRVTAITTITHPHPPWRCHRVDVIQRRCLFTAHGSGMHGPADAWWRRRFNNVFMMMVIHSDKSAGGTRHAATRSARLAIMLAISMTSTIRTCTTDFCLMIRARVRSGRDGPCCSNTPPKGLYGSKSCAVLPGFACVCCSWGLSGANEVNRQGTHSHSLIHLCLNLFLLLSELSSIGENVMQLAVKLHGLQRLSTGAGLKDAHLALLPL